MNQWQSLVNALQSTKGWQRSDLPLELSPLPLTPLFNNVQPIVFFPGWVLLDAKGVSVAAVQRATDAAWLAELVNKSSRNF